MSTGPTKIHGLFPTPVAVYDFEASSEILEILNSVALNTSNSVEMTTQYGIVSENTYIFDNPDLAPLADYIRNEAVGFASEYLGYENVRGMQFTQSWVSHKSPGQYHTMHTHANSVVSGVYYFEDIDENSPIVFHHTVSSNNLNTMDVPTNGPFSASLRVQKNNIVMFPSYLNHSVPINKSNKVRKSLAFNLVPVRTWGHPGSLNELNFSRLK